MMVVAALSGCTLKQYGNQADRAAYSTLAVGQTQALGESLPFEVAYAPLHELSAGEDQPIRINGKIIPLGGDNPQVLTLNDCLEVAFRNSRQYQTRKEELYIDALNLANARRSWDIPLLGGLLEAEASHTSINDGTETNFGAAAVGPTLTQRFVHGGVLTLAATVDWMTSFVPDSTVVGSLLEANLTQPLLRGAWRGFAYEGQYRLERDFLFSVFEYERFRQTFAADILENYYSVLQRKDRLENDRASIKRQERTFALTKIQVEGGQVSRLEQDRAEQSLLRAQIQFEQSQQGYRDALDSFKITMGLPVRASIELDFPNALGELASVGPQPIPFEEPEAIAIAMAARPDVLTERARVRDADRDVEIAADQFYPQLDVELGISAAGTEARRFDRIRFHRHERFAGVTFNYDLDQTDNRDDYREAIIEYEKARRDLEGFLDEVRLDVRASYRELQRSKRSYELEVRNIRIAERRRKLADLQQKEGWISATDVLDAEQDLRLAQNGLTAALVNYTTTRVQFLTTLGMIRVDERGLLYEREAPFKFDGIRRIYPYVSPEQPSDTPG